MKRIATAAVIALLALAAPTYAAKDLLMPTLVSGAPGISGSACGFDATAAGGALVPNCDPSEGFCTETIYPSQGATAWKFGYTWETTDNSASNVNVRFQFTAVCYPDQSDRTTVNPAGGASPATVTVDDASGGTSVNTERVSALSSSALAIFNVGTNANAAPGECEGRRVRICLERVAPGSNELAGKAKVTTVTAEPNP